MVDFSRQVSRHSFRESDFVLFPARECVTNYGAEFPSVLFYLIDEVLPDISPNLPIMCKVHRQLIRKLVVDWLASKKGLFVVKGSKRGFLQLATDGSIPLKEVAKLLN
jgi:hypothetical protein